MVDQDWHGKPVMMGHMMLDHELPGHVVGECLSYYDQPVFVVRADDGRLCKDIVGCLYFEDGKPEVINGGFWQYCYPHSGVYKDTGDDGV